MTVAAPFHDTAHTHPLARVPLADRKRFSFLRAVRAAAGIPDGEKPSGVEAEISEELRAHVPGVNRGGLLLPIELLSHAERTLDSKTATKGVEAVIRTESGLIDLLAPRSVLVQAGATVMAVSGSPLELVVVRGGPTVSWIGENPAADVADSDLTFGLVNAVPKTALSNVVLTRQLIQQWSLGAERVVRRELGNAGARAIDSSVFHGLGAAGQPTGLYANSGVPTVDMSSAIPTYAKLLDLASPVMDAGADPLTMSYIAAPTLASVLQRTPREAAGGWACWERGQIGDFSARFGSLSKTMNGALPTGGSSRGLCFGAWSDMLVPIWAVELIVDPFSKKRRGLVEIALFVMADVATQHPESFSVAVNAAVV